MDLQKEKICTDCECRRTHSIFAHVTLTPAPPQIGHGFGLVAMDILRRSSIDE